VPPPPLPSTPAANWGCSDRYGPRPLALATGSERAAQPVPASRSQLPHLSPSPVTLAEVEPPAMTEHLHADDAPLSLAVLRPLLGHRADREQLGYRPHECGADVDWDLLTSGNGTS
jgi:hypothetical protein